MIKTPLGMIVGVKSIIPYLRAFMSLNEDHVKAWRTIKDWKKRYGLPIHEGLNGQPSVIPEEIVEFFALADDRLRKRRGFKQGVTKGDFLRYLAKGQ